MAEQKDKKKDAPPQQILRVTSSPHLMHPGTTRRIMYEVVFGLLPAVVASVLLFRGEAVGVLVACLVAGLATETIFNLVRHKKQTIGDGSVIITALILGLSLPPTMPAWAAAIGTIVAVAVAKMLFGGLGSNIFNPAMMGRAFLMACFGTMMTTWVLPVEDPLAADPQENLPITQPTPLALAKQVTRDSAKLDQLAEEIDELRRTGADQEQVDEARHKHADGRIVRGELLDHLNDNTDQMFMGQTSGSLGETAAVAWLIGGLFLLWRRTITYHIPVAVLASAAAVATIAWKIDSTVYPHPLVHLLSGGLMMCAFFIATDPVTCPLSRVGRVIFGIGVGALVMLIRLIGGYPEGVMYAVLLMNSVTPLLDRWTRPTPLGGHASAG